MEDEKINITKKLYQIIYIYLFTHACNPANIQLFTIIHIYIKSVSEENTPVLTIWVVRVKSNFAFYNFSLICANDQLRKISTCLSRYTQWLIYCSTFLSYGLVIILHSLPMVY